MAEQNLSQALFGSEPSNAIKLERNRKVWKRYLFLSPDSDAGCVIVFTGTKDRTQIRVHSVFFFKSKQGDWKIWSWHTSSS